MHIYIRFPVALLLQVPHVVCRACVSYGKTHTDQSSSDSKEGTEGGKGIEEEGGEGTKGGEEEEEDLEEGNGTNVGAERVFFTDLEGIGGIEGIEGEVGPAEPEPASCFVNVASEYMTFWGLFWQLVLVAPPLLLAMVLWGVLYCLNETFRLIGALWEYAGCATGDRLEIKELGVVHRGELRAAGAADTDQISVEVL